MSVDRVEGVSKILAQAHPAESLGNIAREIIEFLDGAAPKPQQTTWMKLELSWQDRITGELKSAENQVIEVVIQRPNELLVQDLPSGTHRMIPIANILEMIPR